MTIADVRLLQDAVDLICTQFAIDRPGPHTLQPMAAFMRRLDDPQERYTIIHVAGTSGKTSTSYYLSALLQHAGLRVGTAASPHLISVNERIQINGQPLDAAVFQRYLRHALSLAGGGNTPPTRYELLTALSFYAFAQQQVDYAVVEVGMGGLLDATNVVRRRDKLCLITALGFDHTEILGTSLEQIATAKAGIVHPGNPVIIQRQQQSTEHLLADRVAQRGGHLEPPPGEPTVAATPAYQGPNLALAEAGYRYLRRRDALPQLCDTALRDVAGRTPPGRYEILHIDGRRIILDGAHNPQKLHALGAQLAQDGVTPSAALIGFSGCPQHKLTDMITQIAAMCRWAVAVDTQPASMFTSTSPVATDRIAATAAVCGLAVTTASSVSQGVTRALAAGPGPLVVTGSLYLVAAVRHLLLAEETA